MTSPPNDPFHATSLWLNRLIAANPDTDGNTNLFDAAFHYCKQFLPKSPEAVRDALVVRDMPTQGL